MQKITLSNGEAYGVTYCGVTEGMLFFEITDRKGLMDAAVVFADPENTAVIVYQMDDLPETAHAGYTHLIGVRQDRYTGYTTITLLKEAQHGAV